MLMLLDDWQVRPSGGGLLLVLRNAPSAGEIHYWESKPLQAIEVQARAILSDHREFKLQAASPIFRFQTQEGEYGAGLILDGRSAHVHAPMRIVICSVFAEHFCTCLVATIRDKDFFAELGERACQLAAHDRLMLGVRPRRFVFSPPSDWRIRRAGLSAWMFPKTYPRPFVRLVVPPATPLGVAPDEELENRLRRDDQLYGLRADPGAAPLVSEVKTATGLAGVLIQGSVQAFPSPAPLYRAVVYLYDSLYSYSLQMCWHAEQQTPSNMELLQQVAGSLEPLPQPRLGVSSAPRSNIPPTSSEALSHWSG